MQMEEREKRKGKWGQKGPDGVWFKNEGTGNADERQHLDHEIQLAQSERVSVAGAGDTGAERREDTDDTGEPVEPRLATRPRDRAIVASLIEWKDTAPR